MSKVSARKQEIDSDKAGRKMGSGLTEYVFLVNSVDVELRLITGEVFQGELKDAGTYVVVLMIEGQDVIFYKHAIISIRVLTRL